MRLSLDNNYRVLARKYRPTHFDDLIGQEALVRTLSNAFDLSRIHQAYLLSGVRGVGKTTTARIMARALNYHRAAGDGAPLIDAPTIRMPGLGTHCQAIIESRHVDVVEMDAASHTGIDDVRELIEGSRYRPVMARTKVYIIDEVHMLSKAAFNGLLKTLEEPPDHVKFLFATTEVDKVPVTVRSRCQRFDLRRVEADVMMAHLRSICTREGVEIDDEALVVIARAAEGSVRDALSLLDQAIAHGAAHATTGRPHVGADGVRAMLGLADRARIIDLFEAVMGGRLPEAMTGLKHLHDSGADPGHVVSDLADFVHLVTRLKLVPDAAKDPALTEQERVRGGAFAQALSLPVLTRTWQLLVKGLADVKDAPRPIQAADMVLVRLACAADLPTPDEVIKRLVSMPAGDGAPLLPPPGGGGGARLPALGGGGSAAAIAVGSPLRHAPAVQGAPMASARTAAAPQSSLRLDAFTDVVALAQARRDIQLKLALERDVRLVRFEDGHIEFELAPEGSRDTAANLSRRLAEWTGVRWMVSVVSGGGAPTIREEADAKARSEKDDVAADPTVRLLLDTFPGAEIVAVRSLIEPPAPAPVAVAALDEPDADIGYAEDEYTDDDL
ncbi:DNA polymerase III subunit gamma/tau [Lichenibacterium dinghuense]|uniref:DNA polymerase III subunit gamma/tau n=1 Tax=Lichenibacterium dinghuense TaxID=2895977 RepID=UPI003D186BF1